MKTQDLKSNNEQGRSTSDRGLTDQHDKLKSNGISNAGGQRSDQTSNRDGAHKPEHKKG